MSSLYFYFKRNIQGQKQTWEEISVIQNKIHLYKKYDTDTGA